MASAKATADEEEASKASGGGGARGAEQGRQGGAAQGASLASLLRRKSRSAWSSFDTLRPSFRGGNPVSASAGASASSGKPLSRRPTGSCWGNATRSEERTSFQRESRRREASMPERFFSFSAPSLWEASELGVRATAPRRRGCRFRPQPYTLSFPFDFCGFEKVLLNMARTTCCLILQLESHSRQQVEKKRLSR